VTGRGYHHAPVTPRPRQAWHMDGRRQPCRRSRTNAATSPRRSPLIRRRATGPPGDRHHHPCRPSASTAEGHRTLITDPDHANRPRVEIHLGPPRAQLTGRPRRPRAGGHRDMPIKPGTNVDLDARSAGPAHRDAEHLSREGAGRRPTWPRPAAAQACIHESRRGRCLVPQDTPGTRAGAEAPPSPGVWQ